MFPRELRSSETSSPQGGERRRSLEQLRRAHGVVPREGTSAHHILEHGQDARADHPKLEFELRSLKFNFSKMLEYTDAPVNDDDRIEGRADSIKAFRTRIKPSVQ